MIRRRTQRLFLRTALAASLCAGAVSLHGGAAQAAMPLGKVVNRVADCPGTPTTSYNAAADDYSLYNQARAMGVDAYYRNGFYGQGIDVAVIDSGVAPIAGVNSGNVVDGPDLSFESQAPFTKRAAHANPDLPYNDTFGHGTHMAGIIAGRDVAGAPYGVGDPTKFTGVAPGARILNMKVADSQGAVDITQIIAAVDWVVAHRNDPELGLNVRVLNLSFGVNSLDGPDKSILGYTMEQAWKAGIVVVVAGGNDGRPLGTPARSLLSPANMRSVLAVGSYDVVRNTVSDFSNSSRDRTVDVVAPGEHVMSLHVPGAAADEEILDDCTASVVEGERWTSPIFGPNQRFVRGSGTSQAAAMASGAVALMLSKNPSLTPNQVKAILASTAAPVSGYDDVVGGGRIRLAAAYDAPVPNVTAPKYMAPHGGLLTDGRAGDALPCLSITSLLWNQGTWKNGRWSGGLCSAYLNKHKNIWKPLEVDVRGNKYDALEHARQQEIDPRTGNYVRSGVGKAKRPWTMTKKGEAWNGAVWAGAKVGTNHGRKAKALADWKDTDWMGHRFRDHDWSGHRFRADGWSGHRFRTGSWTGHRFSHHTLRHNTWR